MISVSPSDSTVAASRPRLTTKRTYSGPVASLRHDGKMVDVSANSEHRTSRSWSRPRMLRLSSVVLAALLAAACQTTTAGWQTAPRLVASRAEIATAYQAASDEFANAIEAAFQPYITTVQAANGKQLPEPTREYFAACARATWQFQTRLAGLRGDSDVDAALDQVIALAANEAGSLRRASVSADPVAVLSSDEESDPAGDHHRAFVDALRRLLSLSPSRSDVNNFF